jgi:hypothetical protein
MASRPSPPVIPLAIQLEWYKIRDALFGLNFVYQNISLALELAASCSHPDARWLAECCAGKDVKTKRQARDVFLALGESDARALCFRWFLDDDIPPTDLTLVRRSAEMSYAFAQAEVAAQSASAEECFRLATLAANQNERDGFFQLGWVYKTGDGCEANLDLAKRWFLRACELDDVWAMHRLGNMLRASDPERWRLLGMACVRALHQDDNPASHDFLDSFPLLLVHGVRKENAAAVFAIGRVLKGHVDPKTESVFKRYGREAFDPANRAIAFYNAQLQACRRAVDAWTLVGIELKVVKDIRILIGKLIWDARGDAKYEIVS